jgi:hypothetical protein
MRAYLILIIEYIISNVLALVGLTIIST